MSEKVASLQREMQEQKLLHSQLRDEASSEFRSLYRKSGNHEKDVDLLKYQLKMSSKKVNSSPKILISIYHNIINR